MQIQRNGKFRMEFHTILKGLTHQADRLTDCSGLNKTLPGFILDYNSDTESGGDGTGMKFNKQ